MSELQNGDSTVTSTESPPSLGAEDGRPIRCGSRTGSGSANSGSCSPLLQTDPIPENEEALCPYCHKDYRKPRVLDCLHSMCEDCIIAQLDGRREAAKQREASENTFTDCVLEDKKGEERPTPPGVVRCAVCQQDSNVGNDIRFVYTMLLDYVRLNEAEQAKGERPCGACKSEQAALAYCKQCGSDLCGNCLQAHLDMRMFDAHEVMSYAELEASGRKQDARRVLCPTHSQPLYLLCAGCQLMACRVCMDHDHQGHALHDVTKIVVDAVAKDLSDHVNRVRDKWAASLAAWRSLPNREESIHLQYEKAKLRIELAYEEAAKLLEESKARKIAELEEVRDQQEEISAKMYRQVDMTQTKVDDAISFATRLMEHANGVEMLVSRRKVLQQLNNLEHTIPPLSMEVELEFRPCSRKAIEMLLANVAGDVSCRTLPTNLLEKLSLADQETNPSRHNRVKASESEWNTTNAHYHGGHHNLNGSNGLQAPAVERAPTITPIGGERAARKKGEGAAHANNKALLAMTTAMAPTNPGTTCFNGGWPPSSNPPELPTPSPPKEIASQLGVNALSQHPSAAPTPGIPVTTPTGLTVGNIAASLHPLQLHNLAGLNWPAQLVNDQQRLAAAQQLANLMKQQQIQQNILRQFSSRAMDPALLGPLPDHQLMHAVLNSTVGAAARGSGHGSRGPLGQMHPGNASSASSSRLENDLVICVVFGNGASGTGLRDLHAPGGFTINENDEIIITDTNNHRIVVASQSHPWNFGQPGQEEGQLCFPRRIVALRGDLRGYVVIDRTGDNKSRAQLFDLRGNFIRRINFSTCVQKGAIEVWAAASTPAGYLVLVDQTSTIYVLDIQNVQPRVVTWFDASLQLLEASDVCVYDKNVYISDFKGHGVHVFTLEGSYVRKIGDPSHTPFPIGLDIMKSTGELYIAHTHGNRLTVVAYTAEGSLICQMVNNDFRLSRCAALRITSSGLFCTISKHSHTLYAFKRCLQTKPSPSLMHH